jgi:hypothetical protein
MGVLKAILKGCFFLGGWREIYRARLMGIELISVRPYTAHLFQYRFIAAPLID